MADAGIANPTFHELRHTWATGAAEPGLPKTTRRDTLGHSPTSLTDGHMQCGPEYGKITATAFFGLSPCSRQRRKDWMVGET